MPDLTVSAAVESGPRAYAMAGVGPEDVDVAMLYDAFTINTVLFLEDLGFCEKGRVGPSSRGAGSHREESSPSTPAGVVSHTITLACTGCS